MRFFAINFSVFGFTVIDTINNSYKNCKLQP